ncbi:hypothetical protein CTI12_AA012780 [Artemisia annua]|uniref:Uncharacterized protein n=1 Tax=Artemisia annua TaxID=35608 RepID=A0A2U1PYW0_ARTAN|nr:hypothetical protein CTI12_AA012780 [Artemisia annua]
MMMNNVVCPKPRRVDWLHPMNQSDLEGGNQLLDVILTKECYGVDRANNPFFNGSPPSRSSNPLIQNAQFCHGKPSQSSPVFMVSPSSSTGGSCTTVKLGQKQAAVRVEGFNSRGISAAAY